MAWIILLAASGLEVVWAIALKFSDGFTRLWPSAICVVAAAASFVLLSIALRPLPVGSAYAIWVGLGAAGVATVGILLLGESAEPRRLFMLGLIVVGVAGLHLVDR